MSRTSPGSRAWAEAAEAAEAAEESSAPKRHNSGGEPSGRQSIQSTASSGGEASVLPPEASRSAASSRARLSGEEGVRFERVAWRGLVSRLLALRGDRKVEAMLTERHPELTAVVEILARPGRRDMMSADLARESAKPWFSRGLKGKNRHGHEEKAELCTMLTKTLKAHGASLCDAAGAAEPGRLARLLEEGPASEEGPLICSLLGRELLGSRYEGLWMTRFGPGGQYLLGDDNPDSGLPGVDQDGARIYPRVRVMVKIRDGRLVVDGFFHEGEDDTLNPARVPIGPFLSVYFEGVSLKEALSRWINGAPPPPARSATGRGAAVADNKPDDIKKLELTLPPGWVMRESRSKKGVYYYCHPAKGLSQMERPKV